MLLETERRDYAQITRQQLSPQQLSNKPQHLRGALGGTTSASASPWRLESSAYSFESYLDGSLAICALEAGKKQNMGDLVASVAEGGAADSHLLPSAAFALALAAMDQIEDEGVRLCRAIVPPSGTQVVDGMKLYSSIPSPFVFEIL